MNSIPSVHSRIIYSRARYSKSCRFKEYGRGTFRVPLAVKGCGRRGRRGPVPPALPGDRVRRHGGRVQERNGHRKLWNVPHTRAPARGMRIAHCERDGLYGPDGKSRGAASGAASDGPDGIYPNPPRFNCRAPRSDSHPTSTRRSAGSSRAPARGLPLRAMLLFGSRKVTGNDRGKDREPEWQPLPDLRLLVMEPELLRAHSGTLSMPPSFRC
jgi:hypothetical protein